MYERGLTLMVLIFFDKKTSGRTVKHKIISNKELAQELHRPITRKFEKRKVHSSFIDNIWSVDLADMQLISKFNIRLRFLLCVIDIYSRYAQVIPLKDEKGITITNAFQKKLNESKKSVIAEKFIRTLRNKTYEYMTSVSKNVCIDILDYI